MTRAVTIQTNFTTGEIDPLLASRIDIGQYYNGLDKARNVTIQPQGGVERRQGLQFIKQIDSGGSPENGTRLIPFEFSTTQSYMLLFVNNRMYVYKDKALVTNINGSGNDYLTTAIGSAQLSTLDFAQSFDTLVLVHEDLTPFKLVRGGNDSTWTISAISFEHVPFHAFTTSTTEPSTTVTPSAVDGSITITAGSSIFDANSVNQYIEVKDGLGRARIVKLNSGTVVEAIVEIPFFDTNAIASGDYVVESGYEVTWSGTRGYPRTATFHEGRLYLGGTKSRPNTLFGSRVARFFDFNPGEGLDDDSIEATLDTDSVNAIIGLFSGRDLQIFTKGGEFFVPQSSLDPITPSNIVINGSTRRGAKEGIKPVGVESGTLFIQRSGKAVREFSFSDTELSYVSANVSLLSSHLLNTPLDMALRKATSTTEGDMLMIVNTDGTLVMYSILRDQNITAPSLASTGPDVATITVSDYANIAVGTELTFTDNNGTVITLQSEAVGSSDPSSASGNTHFFRPNSSNNTTADNLFTAFGNISQFVVKNPAAAVVTVKRVVPGDDNLTVTTTDSTRLTVTNFAKTDKFLNVAVDVETVYCVVKRSINGSDVYYVEAFNDDNTTDSAILFTGGTLPGSTSLSGLSHLEGETVKVIVDDAMQANKVVSSGAITLDAVPTSYVEVGLDYTPKVKTLPVELKLPSGNIVAQKKRIVETTANLYLSQNLTVNGNDLAFTAATFFTGKKRRKPMLGYDRNGQITFSQSQPLFFNLLGIEYKVSVGQ
jgi:hypothetical protein